MLFTYELISGYDSGLADQFVNELDQQHLRSPIFRSVTMPAKTGTLNG